MKEYCLLFAWPQADETKDKMQYTIHPEAEEVADMKATVCREVGQLSRGGRGSSGQGAGAAQSPAALFISRVAVIGRDPVDT